MTQNSLEHTLPQGLSDLAMNGSGILYLLDGTLYCRPYMAQTDKVLSDQTAAFAVGPEHMALLKEDGQIWVCGSDGGDLRCLSGKTFPAQARLDVSADRVFVTLPEGEIWSTPIQGADWSLAFDPAA